MKSWLKATNKAFGLHSIALKMLEALISVLAVLASKFSDIWPKTINLKQHHQSLSND